MYLQEAAKPKPDPYLVALAADAEHRAGNNKHAIELYRQALTINYGDVEGAKREAQICLRLQPHMAEAEQIIAKLSQSDEPATRIGAE